MAKEKRTKPRPTLSKKRREARPDWDALEAADWAGDCERREWLASEEYKEAGELAERFRKRL